MSQIGENIRARRQALGLSTQDLERLLAGDIGHSTLNRWEHGAGEPRISDVERLAHALATTPAELAGWNTERPERRPTCAPRRARSASGPACR